MQQNEEEEEKAITSSNPVLELELAEEKLPMTLSRQEVKTKDLWSCRCVNTCLARKASVCLKDTCISLSVHFCYQAAQKLVCS